MERRKISLILLILTCLCANNLFAKEQSKFDKIMETIFPFPILVFEFGKPETFSFDIGLDTLFWELDNESRLGPYLLYSFAKTKNDKFHRVSTGLSYGFIGMLEGRAGLGLGWMPKNKEVLQTFFTELSVRLFLLEIKTISEIPLKPGHLKDYYNETYKNVKFKIGVSI